MAGAPLPDSSAAEAANWYEANRFRIIIANAMVGLTFPALLAFGAAMFELGRDNTSARIWMLMGAFGGVSMVGVFSIVIAGNIVAVLSATGGGVLFELAWNLHNAAFAVNMTVLGAAFLGFSAGAYAAGLTPAWLRMAGLTGASLLLLTGFGNTVVAGGSAFALIGFAGFLLWLVWIIALGLRLLRTTALIGTKE